MATISEKIGGMIGLFGWLKSIAVNGLEPTQCYIVKWRMKAYAKTPQAAAAQIRAMIRSDISDGLIFEVVNEDPKYVGTWTVYL